MSLRSYPYQHLDGMVAARKEGQNMGFEERVKCGRDTVVIERYNVWDSGYEGSRMNDFRTMAERALGRLLGDEDGTYRSIKRLREDWHDRLNGQTAALEAVDNNQVSLICIF